MLLVFFVFHLSLLAYSVNLYVEQEELSISLLADMSHNSNAYQEILTTFAKRASFCR